MRDNEQDLPRTGWRRGDQVVVVKGPLADTTGEVVSVSELPREDSERLTRLLRVRLASGVVEFLSPDEVRRA